MMKQIVTIITLFIIVTLCGCDGVPQQVLQEKLDSVQSELYDVQSKMDDLESAIYDLKMESDNFSYDVKSKMDDLESAITNHCIYTH